MNTPSADPKNKSVKNEGHGYEDPPDQTPRREGGEDAVAEISDNILADEEVIVNQQAENKTVNSPSQSGVHSSESEAGDQTVI
jgi:hypothetical protein